MNVPASLTRPFSHLRRHVGRIDIVRDPYKAWGWLCLIFGIILLVVIMSDLLIFYELQAGRLVGSISQSQTPTPIIDEAALTTTARAYAAKAASLSALQSDTAGFVHVVDPSQ